MPSSSLLSYTGDAFVRDIKAPKNIINVHELPETLPERKIQRPLLHLLKALAAQVVDTVGSRAELKKDKITQNSSSSCHSSSAAPFEQSLSSFSERGLEPRQFSQGQIQKGNTELLSPGYTLTYIIYSQLIDSCGRGHVRERRGGKRQCGTQRGGSGRAWGSVYFCLDSQQRGDVTLCWSATHTNKGRH